MIPEKNQKFNAYVKGKEGTVGFRQLVRGGPFTCAKVDINGVHTADRVFILTQFVFEVIDG